MTRRGVLLCDGPSDMPLSSLVEKTCLELGDAVTIASVDPRVIPGRSVAARLDWLKANGADYSLTVVHRDAEGQPLHERRREVLIASEGRAGVVPVVPVRMTESWLLLDETAIRAVAGNPRGRKPLNLPKPAEVESRAEPKAMLEQVLVAAAEATGRRAKQFRRDFGVHRALLLERLDPSGPVSQLESFRQFRADLAAALDVRSR